MKIVMPWEPTNSRNQNEVQAQASKGFGRPLIAQLLAETFPTERKG